MTHTQQTRLLNVIDRLRSQIKAMPIVGGTTRGRTTARQGARGGSNTARRRTSSAGARGAGRARQRNQQQRASTAVPQTTS